MERKSVFSGSWYPSSQEQLDRIVESGSRLDVPVRFAVLPHAGLYYSGSFISCFFRSLPPSVRRVLIISPSHYYALDDDLPVTSGLDCAGTAYWNVPVFSTALDCTLRADDVIQREHGIEMFLPFIGKRQLSAGFLIISRLSSPDALRRIADAADSLIDEGTAVIASSDFTHYGSRFGFSPYGRNNAEERVEEHDLRLADLLASGDWKAVFEEHRKTTVCGIVPAMIVSALALRHRLTGFVADYGNSNRISGAADESFVSYVSVMWR